MKGGVWVAKQESLWQPGGMWVFMVMGGEGHPLALTLALGAAPRSATGIQTLP